MMVEFANKELDFGALSKMAQDDPEGFDKVKRRLTQALIRRARTSSQGTLLDLQKKLDVLAKQIPEPYIGILSLTSHLESDFAKLDWQLTELRNKYSSDDVSQHRIAAG
jgi:hypothetical protein